MANPSLAGKTVRGFLLTTSGTAVHFVLQTIVTIILARLLGPTDFGTVSAGLIVVNFSLMFSQLGLGPAIVQRKNLDAKHIRTAFAFSVYFSVLIGVLVFSLAGSISAYFRIPQLDPVIRVLSLLFLFRGVSVVAERLLQRNLEFGKLALVNLLSFGVGYGGFGIVLALFDFGPWALVGANLAQVVIMSASYLILQPHPKSLLLESEPLRELLEKGAGFTVGHLGHFLAQQGDSFVIGRVLGPTSLGLYNRAFGWGVTPVRLLGQVLDQVLFPVFSQLQADKSQMMMMYRRGISMITVSLLPITVVLSLLAPEIVIVLLGPDWEPVVELMRVFLISSILQVNYRIDDSVAKAFGAVYQRSWRIIVNAILVVVGAWVGHHWGLLGTSVGVVTAMATNALLMVLLTNKILPGAYRVLGKAFTLALALTSVLGGQTALLVHLLRSSGLAAGGILFVTLSGCVLTGLVLIMLYPSRFLGNDALWVLEKLNWKPMSWIVRRRKVE